MHLAVSEIQLGTRRLFTGVVRDITDLKEAERQLSRMNDELEKRIKERTKQLEQAQAKLVERERLATLGQVAGGIAHEIRNPLNAVKTSVYYLVHAKSSSPEKTAKHLDRIDRQVSHIDNVVTALSDVAKLPDAKLKPLTIHSCIKRVVQEMSFPEGVEVAIDMPDDLPRVLADDSQIAIAFRNLLRNAREAMPEGGNITLTARLLGKHVRLAFTDSGIGIEPKLLSQVMEPLFTTKARGMGLGLSITKAIIEKNQGELDVVSELNNGTTFTVTLQSAMD